MRKLASIVLITLITMSAFAQDGHSKHQNRAFTVDQIATLKTKKMTLLLDLDSQQQQQILEINTQKVSEQKAQKEARKAMRESNQKPTNQQLFELKNERLDAMIAHKADMKKVLNEEQFETWQKARMKKGKHLKKRGAQRKGKGHQRKARR